MLSNALANRWRRARKRGVSPIIATILLVAITVVLAAVLYVLVSGLTHSGAATPYSLGMGTPSTSNPAANTYYEVIVLSPTGGVTTALFGLSVLKTSGTAITSIATASIPTNCKAGNAITVANCASPGAAGWYIALAYQGNSTIISTYAGGATPAWTAATVALSSAMELLLVSYTSYAATGDTLNAVASSSSSVSGSVSL